jgi:uncharacterized membrane protein YadS
LVLVVLAVFFLSPSSAAVGATNTHQSPFERAGGPTVPAIPEAVTIMLDGITRYLQTLSPGAQATIMGALGAFLVFQAVRRYEEQTLIAFLLALVAIVLFSLAFAKAISGPPA